MNLLANYKNKQENICVPMAQVVQYSVMKHRCPICKKIVKVSAKKQAEGAKFFPFCSQRCKLIDLGAWLDARYRVVSEPSGSCEDVSDKDRQQSP